MSDKITSPSCHGRRVIFSPVNEITAANVESVLLKALPLHTMNKAEIIYLENYKRGIQPILQREKEIRPEINNKVVCNRALEIVNFTTGYLLGEPIQYISKDQDESLLEKVKELNTYTDNVDKEFLDRELKENSSTVGTSYRLTLPLSREEDTPFMMYTLDTVNTFVVYHSGLGHKPLLGVMEIIENDVNGVERTKYCCYTDKQYFEIANGRIIKQENHFLNMIPIIEYPNNKSRLGDFEPVLPLLDAINMVYSNRIDGVEQFIQSLMKFINVDIDEDNFKKLLELGAIKVRQDGEGTVQDVQFMTQELNQQQVQVLIDSLYQDILTITGMPNRNGGSSTSDTGSAVIMRDGWEAAEARAKSSELIFKRSEKKTLKIVLLSMNKLKNVNLDLKDIDIKFTRRNYENINQKSTVLTTLLGSDKIHPKLAFEHCGLFTDPETAYIISKQYSEKLEKVQQKLIENEKENNINGAETSETKENKLGQLPAKSSDK